MRRWLFFLGAALVCGLLALGVSTVYIVTDVGSDIRSTAPTQRLVCPGQHVVQLSDSGLHYVYFEYIANHDSATYSMDSLPCQASVTVADGSTGKAGPIRRARNQVRYSWPERAGLALLEFDVITPGDFTIEVTFQNSVLDHPLIFAVGSASSISSWLDRVLLLFASCFVLLYLGAAILWRRLKPPQGKTPGDSAI